MHVWQVHLENLGKWTMFPTLISLPDCRSAGDLIGLTSAIAQETPAQGRLIHALVTGSSVMPVSPARSGKSVLELSLQ